MAIQALVCQGSADNLIAASGIRLTSAARATLFGMAQARQQLFVNLFNAFTIVLLAWFFGEFVTKGSLAVPNALAEIYLLILVFYAGDKELHRWHHKMKGTPRHGELLVYAWAVLGVVTYATERISGGFRVPRDLALVVWSVIIIYVITEFLKSEFHRHR